MIDLEKHRNCLSHGKPSNGMSIVGDGMEDDSLDLDALPTNGDAVLLIAGAAVLLVACVVGWILSGGHV